MQLKLGHIDYLNCEPLFYNLLRCGFTGTIVQGVPAELNKLLSSGQIDVSPSSSFEYGSRYSEYSLLSGHSISAYHQVQSVALFTHTPIEDLEGQIIYLTGESATSVNLLRVLLREYYGWQHVVCQVPDEPVEQLLAEGKPVLLIGDRALKLFCTKEKYTWLQYDLAQLWQQQTHLPFVFALWIVRREIIEQKRDLLLLLQRQLTQSREMAFSDLYALAQTAPAKAWIDDEQLVDYWRSMSYLLTSEHLCGLELFFELCVKYQYLPEMPILNFVEN